MTTNTIARVAEVESAVGFTRAFNATQEFAHGVNVANGWWENRRQLEAVGGQFAKHTNILALLALAHTELSEAVEAVRKHDPATWNDPFHKDTLVREMAGTIVRLMDLAQEYQLPLATAVLEEIQVNASRGIRHGGKAL